MPQDHSVEAQRPVESTPVLLAGYNQSNLMVRLIITRSGEREAQRLYKTTGDYILVASRGSILNHKNHTITEYSHRNKSAKDEDQNAPLNHANFRNCCAAHRPKYGS